MKNPLENISLTSYHDIFKPEESREADEIRMITLGRLKPYESQPFKVRMDESMEELIESIRENGVVSPLIARPKGYGEYEILSGHRRAKACEIAGIKRVPVIVKALDDDTAAILLVDSNLQRENILPSEKAFAYKLKLDAMKRQGARSDLTSGQFGQKLTTAEIIGAENGESYKQVQRYVRLTNLIDPLLEMVDEKKIALNAAVELSYLGSKEQAEVLQTIEKEETPPSIAQAAKIRKLSEESELTENKIDAIMRETKPEKIKITLSETKLRKYFPKNYSKQQMENVMLKLLEDWRNRQYANQEER